MMTEFELVALGFTKEFSIDLIEDELDFYYYTLDIVEGLCFITQASDEVEKDEWIAEIFNTNPTIKFRDVKSLTELINLLNQDNEDKTETI